MANREMPLTIPERFAKTEINDLRIGDVRAIAKLNGLDPVDLAIQIYEPRCRKCGCTQQDCRQCIKRTGSPCCWVEADLCSACV